jgi:hypothetical protein
LGKHTTPSHQITGKKQTVLMGALVALVCIIQLSKNLMYISLFFSIRSGLIFFSFELGFTHPHPKRDGGPKGDLNFNNIILFQWEKLPSLPCCIYGHNKNIV